MIKILYAESHFKSLIDGHFFYQDRTNFLEELENWKSKFPVFLRPRRFGKSLFISLLHYYYGLEHKAIFQSLFGNLYIGQHPTPLANSYMILRFEFSRIDTATHESTYDGFLTNVLSGARRFMSSYSSFFTHEQIKQVEACQSPESVVKTLFDCMEQNNVPHKIYLLIDEYDHFANELLSFDMPRFKNDVSKNGFVRKFYESFKTATNEGIIDRIFITGVSPITLDSLTSGFNIADNISTNPIFHDLMGFTHEEVTALLRGFGIPEATVPDIMTDLAEWYDGYKFAIKAKHLLFNPDMVLYFLKEYSIDDTYPEVMLDTNIISDYRKISNIFKIGGSESSRLELLAQLVKDGYIDFRLTRLYNLELDFSKNDFLSLLFYMGLLSFKEKSPLGWRCEIPNYVIKKLYFEYFAAIQLQQTRFAGETRPIEQALALFLDTGNPEPFFKITEEILIQHHSNRDEIAYGEKHLQTLLIGLLAPYEAYFIHSEYETGRGYPDIFLERIPHVDLNFEIVFELKYVKKSDKDKLEQVVADAQIQLDGYMTSKRFARPDVRGFYIVFYCGTLYNWGEWGKY